MGRMYFADHFDAGSLDAGRWRTRDNSGQSNNDAANLASNVRLTGSVVQLWGTPDAVRGKRYGGAYFDSDAQFGQAQGLWQARMRFPFGSEAAGMWPAVWMRPRDGGLGEIDLMEAWSLRDQVSSALHHDYLATGAAGHVSHIGQEHPIAKDGAWHLWELEWSAAGMTFRVDGAQVWAPSTTRYPWLRDTFGSSRPFTWRICLQIGGAWGGPPDAATDWSVPQLELDWVRVAARST